MKNYQLCRNFFITKFQSKRVCHQFNFIQRCSLLCEKNLDKSRKDDRNRLQNSTEDQDYSTLKKKSLIYRMQNVYFTKLQHNFSCSVLCLVIKIFPSHRLLSVFLLSFHFQFIVVAYTCLPGKRRFLLFQRSMFLRHNKNIRLRPYF